MNPFFEGWIYNAAWGAVDGFAIWRTKLEAGATNVRLSVSEQDPRDVYFTFEANVNPGGALIRIEDCVGEDYDCAVRQQTNEPVPPRPERPANPDRDPTDPRGEPPPPETPGDARRSIK